MTAREKIDPADAAVEAAAREERMTTSAEEARKMPVTPPMEPVGEPAAARSPEPARREPNKPTLYHVFRLDVLLEAEAWVEVCQVEDHSRERAVLSVWQGMVDAAQREGGDALAELQGTQLVAVADSSFKVETPKYDFKPRVSL